MPIIGRRPAVFLKETGEISVVLTEISQRSRGKTLFKDASSKQPVLYVSETPPRGEQLGWLATIRDGIPVSNPTVTPILVLENDSTKGVRPNKVRYLRNCISPEVVYYKTGEIALFWWMNGWTPTLNK